jgi:heme/copper-type cytochrome/quinol oxidase subunit 2
LSNAYNKIESEVAESLDYSYEYLEYWNARSIIHGAVSTLYPHIVKLHKGAAFSRWHSFRLDAWSKTLPRFKSQGRRALVDRLTLFKFPKRHRLGQLFSDRELWLPFLVEEPRYANNRGNLVPMVETTRFMRASEIEISPVFAERTQLDLYDVLDGGPESNSLFKIKYSHHELVEPKSVAGPGTFILKQKRPKIPNISPIIVSSEELDPLYLLKHYLLRAQPALYNSGFIQAVEDRVGLLLDKKKIATKRAELMSTHLSRRLLRTQRTLVLPAQVNLTLVTNSYDVIHSWFLPALGLKMDCVPGRSTHHTFYIDNLGFFYGQCAEICGRYHHHMPIRLCLLPFEHFFVWWQHFGLPRVLGLENQLQDDAELPRYKFF